ncbi:class I tRNA ligase family protein, partial [Candidatus Uhrbacteria bacterium]|nr:class I tRNA ligase family protein [Candidatus Uhrbacteria bacterium]
FVSTEEGTGIVHTAVMYGADDFELGQKLGLPRKHLVDLQGKFISEVTPWAGLFVKDADPLIIGDLLERGLLYGQEKIRHTYPFCWRCQTPLLYYAKESWFVRMSALRDKLIASNKTIHWYPSYIKEGRFGEWLAEVKDWAFSRERYWGTPLPVWVCEQCQTKKVIGGFEDFPESASGNRYFIMRHGESENNVAGIVTQNGESHLTELGKKQVQAAIQELKRQGSLDLIVASPVLRTQETAALISKALNIPIVTDERIREVELGSFEGKTAAEYNAWWTKSLERTLDRFDTASKGAETLRDLTRRLVDFLKDIDRQYQGKRILMVSHGDPLWVLEGAVRGLSKEGILAFGNTSYIKKGELRAVPFRRLPFGADGLVDPHRPFVDGITFSCACGGTMRRSPEVIDVWFDSGAMPTAQWHYPFENRSKIDGGEAYPADYISEAIDQTRGWFYTLLAVATLLGREAPYKNVICLGHIVDASGKKMSKSLGNVVDPWKIVRAYGADAVRFFMYTISQPGDTKRFDPQDLDRIVKQTFMILWNVLAFWKLYVPKNFQLPITDYRLPITHLMDRWILARLHTLTKIMTERLEAYEVTSAGRAITEFINDLSTWYVRRSRERFKDGSSEAVATLGSVLGTLAKLMAPFTPFLAEQLYRQVTAHCPLPTTHSVHLEDWPKVGEIDAKLLGEMAVIRQVAELGHALRAEAKIRLRQPLADFEIKMPKGTLDQALLDILVNELNVKQAHLVAQVEERQGYILRSEGGLTVALAFEITEELRREGWLREIVRHVNELRKEAKLTIRDRITVYYDAAEAGLASLLASSADELQKATLADRWEAGRGGVGKVLEVDGQSIWLGIDKKGKM